MGLRSKVTAVIGIGVLVDLFGYAGENGGEILRKTDITTPAAPVYEGVGFVAHNLVWKEGVRYYYDGFREIYRNNNP